MNAVAPRAQPASTPRVERLPDLDALQAHRAPWFALWRCIPDATPFQSPAWLLCWAEHYAPDRTGAVVVRDGGGLLALLAYFSWAGALWLAGTGPSDYGDALIAQRAAPQVDALLETLAAIADEYACDRIELCQLRAGSRLLRAATPRGWRSEIAPGDACMSLRLGSGHALDGATAHCRRNIACASHRLDRAGPWTLQRVPADESHHAADVLLGLHERRWGARGEPAGLFADVLLRDFVHDVIPRLGCAGLLRFYMLKLDHRPLAATFAMHASGATYFYGTGFDPEAARFSPGLLSIAAAIQGAAAEGDQAFHFLRGRERYKQRLGASEHATCRRVLRRGEPR
jgi:CelD/BcsL family acetyltransferase involved in cellulose biosynthesis